MCSINKTYIPDKHVAFWNMHFNDILMNAGYDQQIFDLLMSIHGK